MTCPKTVLSCGGAIPTPVPSLFERIRDSGVFFDHHHADLYFRDTTESRLILADFPQFQKNATSFRNQRPPNVGQAWLCVPFAYLPFWEEAQRWSKGIPQPHQPKVSP